MLQFLHGIISITEEKIFIIDYLPAFFYIIAIFLSLFKRKACEDGILDIIFRHRALKQPHFVLKIPVLSIVLIIINKMNLRHK